MSEFEFSTAPIDAARLAEPLASPAAGGFAAFEGRVRDLNEGRSVIALEYEAFEPLAVAEGERIVDDALGATARRARAACTGSAASQWERSQSGSASARRTAAKPSRLAATSSTPSSTGCRSGRRNTTRTATAAG